MTVTTRVEGLKASDFASDQEVRWCPGCGDYAIVKAVQKTLADVGAERHNTVFVSGIGCASRLPYYMSTYGFHTIHGRAPAFVTGIKLANPDLDVWMVTGDGDGLSIGGNHLLHILRRNVDVQILLFNNEIYGLTKGQYSPASRVGTRSPSTPMGSVEAPVSACALALGAIFVVESTRGVREIPADNYFKGLYETERRPDELLIEARIPARAPDAVSVFMELAQRQGDFAIAGLACHARIERDVVTDARLVYFASEDKPTLANRTMAAISGRKWPDESSDAALEALAGDLNPMANLQGSAAMKLHLQRVLTRRVLDAAVERAGAA